MDYSKWNETVEQNLDSFWNTTTNDNANLSQHNDWELGQNTCQKNAGMYSMAPGYNCSPIVEDIYKTTRKIETALYLQEKRAEFKEAERERRKSQVDVVEIDEHGRVTARTINTRKEYGSRSLTNFSEPELKIITTKNSIRKVYLITFKIGKCSKRIFVDEAESGDGSLLLKKFNAVGADFLVERRSKKILSATQLLALLLKYEPVEIDISPEPGWYVDTYGELKFFEEDDLTWKDLTKII